MRQPTRRLVGRQDFHAHALPTALQTLLVSIDKKARQEGGTTQITLGLEDEARRENLLTLRSRGFLHGLMVDHQGGSTFAFVKLTPTGQRQLS